MGTLPVVLSEAADLTSTFETALGTVKTDVMSYVGAALPVGLAIVGTFLAIKLGVKFFKSIAK